MMVLHIVGARPNFMKAAPVIAALGMRKNISQILLHTGQHYDKNMSSIFFEEIGIPRPDINLEVGSGTHAEQTGMTMIKVEKIIRDVRPDIVLVYGDVNSTLAGAIVCSKLNVKIAHVEAGLRSWDRTMPEEINRILTDQIADILFTPSIDADHNLLREGIDKDKIHMVGNVMIDTLVNLLPKIVKRWDDISTAFHLQKKNYVLVTLHRPSNVDDLSMLSTIMRTLSDISQSINVVFPVHPRTRACIQKYELQISSKKFLLHNPMGYLDFLCLQKYALSVITDSGGIQEETTFLNVPCLTVRNSTERPVTVELGTNTLVGTNVDVLKRRIEDLLSGNGKRGQVPPLWDGLSSERIAQVIENV